MKKADREEIKKLKALAKMFDIDVMVREIPSNKGKTRLCASYIEIREGLDLSRNWRHTIMVKDYFETVAQLSEAVHVVIAENQARR